MKRWIAKVATVCLYIAVTPVILILVSLAILFIADPYFLEIDSCLDRGGCWDDTNRACEFKDQAKCTPQS